MSAWQSFTAGIVVAVTAGIALAGWAFDITLAKSLLPSWRNMVPSTAFSFILLGLALVAGGGWGSRHPLRAPLLRLLPLAAVVLPLITVVEYLSDTRFGVENWLGFTFPLESATAGRMSPQTSLCFTVICLAVVAAASSRPAAARAAQVASSATLVLSWLAVLAISFDTNRLLAAPRFPGMAAHTILLMAITSAGALELAMMGAATGLRAQRAILPSRLFAAAFLLPLGLGAVQVAAEEVESFNPEVVTALVAMIFASAVAAVGWAYVARLTLLQGERAAALAELEQRVAVRTHELAASNHALRNREDLLQDADRRKDEFLATLAHELRNPLAPIRNAVGLLRDGHAAPADQQAGVIIIERQVALMVRLIDDLLDVSRITAGKLPLHRAAVELDEVIEQAIVSSRPHVVQAGHRLLVTPLPEPVFVDGDFARLSQVFANLLHNACKYTEPGGTITVTVTAAEAASVEVSIRDTGIGIPAAFIPRLFETFSQAVQTAHDGEAALVIAASFQPDAILLDLGMPKLDGYEVCRRIRQAPGSADVLIVAQTGWGQEQDRARTKAAGFDGHLTKPIDPAILQDMLSASRIR